MTVPPTRRPLLLFAAAIGVQLLLLAFQIRRDNNVRLIRVWAADAFTPIDSAGTTSIGWLGGLWHGYIYLLGTHAENQRLNARVGQLQLEVDQLRGQAAEASRLAALLDFRQSHPSLSLLGARVISANPAPSTRIVYIDRGKSSGVERDMGVITADGVVGKILEVYPGSAQVLLITDRESGVGALLAPTRTQGVAKGTGGPMLNLDYIATEKVQPGEVVLTSGLDQVFPTDLPVGKVLAMQPRSPFERIEVEPAAHLDRLEDVLVILNRPATPPTAAADPPNERHR
ncbi:MAG: rod shape-determining protein MreC [Acidobacteriota bacterium]|nr:rod shape-determining protein MreC [Acidobacteriota bacterium]